MANIQKQKHLSIPDPPVLHPVSGPPHSFAVLEAGNCYAPTVQPNRFSILGAAVGPRHVLVALLLPLAGYSPSPSSGAAAAGAPTGSQSALAYPPARRADVVDDYNGFKVPDPYRWLEQLDSIETRNWVR